MKKKAQVITPIQLKTLYPCAYDILISNNLKHNCRSKNQGYLFALSQIAAIKQRALKNNS